MTKFSEQLVYHKPGGYSDFGKGTQSRKPYRLRDSASLCVLLIRLAPTIW